MLLGFEGGVGVELGIELSLEGVEVIDRELQVEFVQVQGGGCWGLGVRQGH
jgi:hypothetical protein